MEIEYEPRFLEEAVLRAASAHAPGRLYYRERERIYGIADPEERGRAFDALNAAWYERLGLGQPLARALVEQPLVLAGVARCAVGTPPHRRDVGADLLVGPQGRLLRLFLPPELLLAGTALVAFLRRELQHVADMLDPRFGYEPQLPVGPAGPAQQRLARDRYRVVWKTTVDGRLARADRLPPSVRLERREEFLAAFPAASAAFDRFFDDPAPTHAAIVAFIGRTRGGCALCGFPTPDPEPDPEALAAEAGAEIAADFPAWRPADGCCRQCADLYRARPVARAGAAALPGVR